MDTNSDNNNMVSWNTGTGVGAPTSQGICLPRFNGDKIRKTGKNSDSKSSNDIIERQSGEAEDTNKGLCK